MNGLELGGINVSFSNSCCAHHTEKREDPSDFSITEHNIINRWEHRFEFGSLVFQFIKLARNNPDSRLAKQNYELSTRIQAHHDLLPESAREDFRFYAIGRTVSTDRANDDSKYQ
jgi:hypothetical protein